MNVPFLDLRAQLPQYREAVLRAIQEVVDEQGFVLGPRVAALQEAIAELCGVEHAIGVSSGSDALLISLMALGIGPGDEVLTSPFSFFATAGAVARLGARPVFVDIDPHTFNLDDEELRRAIGPSTRAVIPVHLFGQIAQIGLYDARRADRPAIVEDAAQALGASLRGRAVGQLGDMACLSFFPSKNLGCFGDGGMVLTRDPELASHLRSLRVQGAEPKYHHPRLGGNFRLDALQAAVLLVKLPHLAGWSEGRRQNAAAYTELLHEAGLLQPDLVQPPKVLPEATHVFNQYTLRVQRRDELKAYLREQGVGTAVYYPEPLHLQPCFSDLGYGPGDFPRAEHACSEVLSLPVFAELGKDQLAYVVKCIAAFYGA